MNKFDSETFFEDDYFTDEITYTYSDNSSLVIKAIVDTAYENDQGGTFDTKVGTWKRFSVYKTDMAYEPEPHDTITFNGRTYEVDNYEEDLDVYIISAYSARRARR